MTNADLAAALQQLIQTVERDVDTISRATDIVRTEQDIIRGFHQALDALENDKYHLMNRLVPMLPPLQSRNVGQQQFPNVVTQLQKRRA